MGRPLAGWGTKVYRAKDGMVTIVPPEVEYSPPEGSVEIAEVRHVVITFPVDGPIIADLELFPLQNHPIDALPRYFVRDKKGFKKQIQQILFADGTSWEMP
jgi:hypothetical protein